MDFSALIQAMQQRFPQQYEQFTANHPNFDPSQPFQSLLPGRRANSGTDFFANRPQTHNFGFPMGQTPGLGNLPGGITAPRPMGPMVGGANGNTGIVPPNMQSKPDFTHQGPGTGLAPPAPNMMLKKNPLIAR